mgnify:CR=1 FL=1
MLENTDQEILQDLNNTYNLIKEERKNMRVLKPIYFTGAIAIALIGCKSVTTIPVPKGINNVVSIGV